MKSKIFKKILASLLACSTVVAMSGVAAARKKRPKAEKTHTAPKDPAKKKAKRKTRKFVTIKKISKKDKKAQDKSSLKSCEGEAADESWRLNNLLSPVYIPRYYMPIPSVKKDYFNGNGDLMLKSITSSTDILSKDCLDDRCVVDITHSIKSFKLNGNLVNLKKCSMEKKLRIMNVLINWAKSGRITRKENVVVAIVDLAQSEFFDEFNDAQKLNIFKTLVECFENNWLSGSDVAWAFKRLLEAGFVDKNESSEEVQKLQKILKDFAKSADSEPDIGLDYVNNSDDDNSDHNDNRNFELNFFNNNDCDDDLEI